MTFYTNGSERARIDTSGKVGINVTPAAGTDAKLQVTGGTTNATTLATAYSVASTVIVPKSSSGYSLAIASGTGDLPQLQVSANGAAAGDLLIQPYGGNVGIGTSSPLGKVQISGTTQGLTSGYGQLNVFSTDAIGANKGGKISFGGVSGASGYDPYGFCSIGGYKENATSSNFLGYLLFATSDAGGSVAERMRIDGSGNVGIGTASPNASAILDAQSTTKGVRFPNMTTTQKNAISSPAAGLVVFDTTLSKLAVYSGTAWQTITSV
jgi:hypothetical protein